jgi:hypothetical protein
MGIIVFVIPDKIGLAQGIDPVKIGLESQQLNQFLAQEVGQGVRLIVAHHGNAEGAVVNE